MLMEAFWRLRYRLTPERPAPWHKDVLAAGYYPAYADWMGVFALDPSGAVWFAPHAEDWSAAERVTEAELCHVARVQAARWTVNAIPFLPQRDQGAQTCPSCHGTGKPNTSARHWSKVMCECGGLGWVPAGWRAKHTSGGRWAEHGLEQPNI